MHIRTIIIVALCLLAGSAFGTQSSVPFINADDVHAQGIGGLGVTVAVIDTGIYYDHPGLAGSIAPGGLSIIQLAEIPDGGQDIWGDGHGTYMSLIITAAGSPAVAYDARVLPVRVFTWYSSPNGPVLGTDPLNPYPRLRDSPVLAA